MKIDHVRELALKALYQINQEDGYSNLVLENIIEQERKKLTEKDVGFISELVYGVTTWKLTLDTIIQKYSKIKIKKMSGWVINILRMGAYQIVFLNKVPKSAAVNESVNLCKKYAIKSTGFVNAILRKIESKDIEEFKKILNPIERISKETSMPEWLVKCLNDSYGIKKAEEICKFSNIKPKVTIRVNQLRTTKKEVKTLLEERSIEGRGLAQRFSLYKRCKKYNKFRFISKRLFYNTRRISSISFINIISKRRRKYFGLL